MLGRIGYAGHFEPSRQPGIVIGFRVDDGRNKD